MPATGVSGRTRSGSPLRFHSVVRSAAKSIRATVSPASRATHPGNLYWAGPAFLAIASTWVPRVSSVPLPKLPVRNSFSRVSTNATRSRSSSITLLIWPKLAGSFESRASPALSGISASLKVPPAAPECSRLSAPEQATRPSRASVRSGRNDFMRRLPRRYW